MNIFLKLKHWQLFILLFGVVILSRYLFISAMLAGQEPSLLLDTGLTMFMMLVLANWMWVIATACYEALPEHLSEQPKLIKMALVYLVTYIATGPFIWESFQTVWLMMNLLGIVAFFYAFDFTARQLGKVEQQKKITFSEYAGTFVLFLFLPIGVWSIQPKVNKLVGTREQKE